MRFRFKFVSKNPIVAAIVLIILLFITVKIGGCGVTFIRGWNDKRTCEEKIRQASKITVRQKFISFFGKHYYLYVDGHKVGHVTGKFIKTFGDVFTLKTADGKKLADEKEAKRILALNRSAEFHDGTGNIIGYIGEERLTDFFSLGYVFHFYDPNQKEIGKSQKIGKSSLSYHHIYDSDGNTDYTVDKKFTLFCDKYVLKIVDRDSRIPLESAILLVCIEDAIADAHKPKKNTHSESKH
jgi:uncharacterized protein YxjI